MSDHNTALIIGVSEYPTGYPNLPAVASDAREVAQLLGSAAGAFNSGSVSALLNDRATRTKIGNALREILGGAKKDDTVFVYIAGHGSVSPTGEYYFAGYDADADALDKTAVPLLFIKQLFDECLSEQLFLWLDFCHSGGILSRGLRRGDDAETEAMVARTLGVVRGRGKIIMCACTANQLAYEDAAHGRFTKHLLKGLDGEAANRFGEVTATSLHDYIDHAMGSAKQRPMLFGTFTGRIVLMHARNLQASESVAGAAQSRVVNDSGPWVLLGNIFLKTSKVRHLNSGTIQLEIPSEGAADDAQIRAFAPEQSWARKSLPFAHRNDASLVRVSSLTGESSGQEQIWGLGLETISVDFENNAMSDISLGGSGKNYSGDQIAEMRARRLLLNDPPPPDEIRSRRMNPGDMLETFIQGLNTSYPARECVFRILYPQFKNRHFLEISRLQAIYALKASHVFEQILELNVGPLSNDALDVFCRGRRRRAYSNQPAVEFTISGRCSLT